VIKVSVHFREVSIFLKVQLLGKIILGKFYSGKFQLENSTSPQNFGKIRTFKQQK